jgi:hypothetical protein
MSLGGFIILSDSNPSFAHQSHSIKGATPDISGASKKVEEVANVNPKIVTYITPHTINEVNINL